jgi:hypothetical protein
MTADQLSQVQEYAMYLFSEDQIALILEIDLAEMQQPAAIRAMNRGRLIAEAAVRKSILQMAQAGSSPAQKQFIELAARAQTLLAPPRELTDTAPAKKGLDFSDC